MRKIGLVGGLALRAGIFYYESIARKVRERGAGTLRLVFTHADLETVLGMVAAGDKQSLGHYLAELGDELTDAGADLVAISAVAPHLAIQEAQRASRARFLNLLDAVPDALAARDSAGSRSSATGL